MTKQDLIDYLNAVNGGYENEYKLMYLILTGAKK